MDQKDDIMKDIYNNFYGGVKDTFDDARKNDKSITYEDVKKWYEKDIPKLTNLRGYNSFIANFAHEEYQMDL